MPKRVKEGGSREVENGLYAVGEALPDGVDRRRFLQTAVAGTVLGLAGCSGGGSSEGGGETTAGGGGGEMTEGEGTSSEESSLLGSDVGFRLPVEPGPNYVTAFAAQQEGFWEEAGITPLTPEGGNGSGDTSKRIGTGVNKVGHAAATPQVAGLAREQFDILQFGTAKARTQAGLIHRTDKIPDPYDPNAIEGAKIAAADGLDKQMWELFLSGIGAPDDITIEYIDTSSAATLLDRGDIHAIWDSINDYAELDYELDIDLGFGSLYPVVSLGGYYMIVNGSWYEENDMAEWTRKLMEGYSAAGHWVLTNREAAMNMLTDVVPELQTLGTEQLLRALAAGVAATNTTDAIKQNGFGYLDPDVQQTTFETISRILDIETPSAQDVRLTEVTDEVELTTFTSSEWSDLQSFAEPYSGFFEGK